MRAVKKGNRLVKKAVSFFGLVLYFERFLVLTGNKNFSTNSIKMAVYLIADDIKVIKNGRNFRSGMLHDTAQSQSVNRSVR